MIHKNTQDFFHVGWTRFFQFACPHSWPSVH